MRIERSTIEGLVLIEPRVFEDERGSFLETYHDERYRDAGIPSAFRQDNCSTSHRNVLRGLHYQVQHPQGHLVTVTHGTIFDVGVDLRPNSASFGRWFGTILTASPPRQAFLPPGVAHGFCVLSDVAELWYKCTEIYHANDEGGLLWCDPELGIEWPLSDPIIAPKDATFPRLRDIPPDRLPRV
ncbi:MAG: dTDP-4-dehydrorhamnose 3,5-epimerase [Kiloniellales bacterium]